MSRVSECVTTHSKFRKFREIFGGKFRPGENVGNISDITTIYSTVVPRILPQKAMGQFISTSEELPPLDEEGQLEFVSEEVLEFREQKLRSRVIRECLIRWRGLLVEDAPWESKQVLQHPGLALLEGKQFREGRTVMYLSK
jgi:hypothetical protein